MMRRTTTGRGGVPRPTERERVQQKKGAEGREEGGSALFLFCFLVLPASRKERKRDQEQTYLLLQ